MIERTSTAHGTARIVVTSSSLHTLCRELNLDSLSTPTPPKSPAAWDGWWRYGRSKLAVILFTHHLSKLEQDKGMQSVYVNCYFPGNIATDAMDTWKDMVGNFLGAIPRRLFRLVGQSLEDGATTAMYLASSQEVQERDIKGRYFIPIAAEGQPSQLTQDKDLSNNLWYWSDHKVTSTLGTSWQDLGKSSVQT